MTPGSSAASASCDLDGPDADLPDWQAEPHVQTTAYLPVDARPARLRGMRRGIADIRIGVHARRGQEARR